MSFKKSIQSLRSLTEAPLPPLMDPKILYPEKQKDARGNEYYDAQPIFGKIDKVSKKERDTYGLERLGEGSSRVAITLRVNGNEFTKEGRKVLRDYGIKDSGNVKTIIKLALNAKGVAQNTSEIRAWEKTKSRLFVPVLDSSANNKRVQAVEINGEPVPPQYSNWIQTIEVVPFSNSKTDPWYAALEKFFGVPGPILQRAFANTGGGQRGFAEAIDAWKDTYKPSKDQLDNLKELLRAAKGGEMAMGDLIQPANWGAIGDRLFVLDYGFDVATVGAYRGTLKLDVSVSDDGVLSVDFKGDKDAVSIAKDKLQPS